VALIGEQRMAEVEGTAKARRVQYSHGATARGRRTRSLLLAAARQVFERDGYLNARVADIVTLAGVSHGTFYTYFDSRTEVIRAIMTEVNKEMIAALAVVLDEPGHPDGLDFRRGSTSPTAVSSMSTAGTAPCCCCC
jgi:AcrR family transcriptional regulator